VSAAGRRLLAELAGPDCGDACPVYPGQRYLDWDLPDPAGLPVEQVRPIRDQISARVRALISELGA
jgi:protein-tyrosine-phosphatase